MGRAEDLPVKLPPDKIVADLLRFGFRETDIARRFEVEPVYVTLAKRRLGLPMKPNGRPRHKRNMAMPASRYFG